MFDPFEVWFNEYITGFKFVEVEFWLNMLNPIYYDYCCVFVIFIIIGGILFVLSFETVAETYNVLVSKT